MIEVVEELVHDAIGVPLDGLDALIVIADDFAVRFGTEFTDHFGEQGDRLFEEADLFVDGFDVGAWGAEEDAFTDFFDGFGDAVEGSGERFDVLPFEGGDEVRAEGFGDLLRDPLVLAPALVEVAESVLDVLGAGGGAAYQFAEEEDRLFRLRCAVLKETVEGVVATEQGVDDRHREVAWLTVVKSFASVI